MSERGVKQGEAVEDNRPQPESCGESLQGHFDRLVFAAGTLGGIGAGCPEAYQACVEFAEMIRIGGNHEPYTAKPAGYGAFRGSQLRSQMIQGAEPTQPDEPDVKRAYDALTPEQKRRLN